MNRRTLSLSLSIGLALLAGVAVCAPPARATVPDAPRLRSAVRRDMAGLPLASRHVNGPGCQIAAVPTRRRAPGVQLVQLAKNGVCLRIAVDAE